MMQILLVFVGGGVGAVLRYLVGRLLPVWEGSSIPWATFAVNVLGSLLIGFLMGLFTRASLSNECRLLLVVGVCGGFTTYSSFAWELLTLYPHQPLLWLYALLTFISCFVATAVGFYCSLPWT